MLKYFGTDGIRGEVGIYPITPDFALSLGYAAGTVLHKLHNKPVVVIGKDTRISGYLFESSLEAGLSYAGVDVYMAGPLPTPAIAYLVNHLKLSAGIVISASHNPYGDNGIKFFSASGTKLSNSIESAIEQQISQPMVKAQNLGKVKRLVNGASQYIDFCISQCQVKLNQFKIVLDCANGATYKVAPEIFSRLGANVIPISCNPDGTNINLNCGSTNPQELIQHVVQHKADLGIAFDGDGDRVVFVDSKGVIYNGDKLIYAILMYQLKKHHKQDGIVGTIMTNMAMEKALEQLQVPFIRSKVGDRYVLEELNQRGWKLGGEASGHILCLDKHTTGDGIISALQVLEALVYLKQTLSEIITWNDYPQIIVNVPLQPNQSNWQDKIEPIVARATKELKNKGRVIVRKSGTEPVLRVMVEAINMQDATLWSDTIVNYINS